MNRNVPSSFALVLLLPLWLSVTGRAHDPGISTAQGQVLGDRIEITTGFAPADVQELLPSEFRTGQTWTEAEFEAAREALVVLAPQIWEVRAGDATIAPRAPRVELLPGDNVSFYLVYPRPAGTQKVTLRAPKIPELPAGHRQFVIITDDGGSTIAKKLLSARDVTLEVPLSSASDVAEDARGPNPTADAPTFLGFLRLGVEHIWTGYDHLLFLFALLIVCRSFRSIVTIITCFTIAHSLTLALATLEWVNLPATLVEPAIAASIVFVGVENLWRRGEEPRGRWALTFAFGLIHGFGFASVLRDLGVGRSAEGIAIPLLSFNLGVELGQIAIAAIVLPFVWRLRKQEWFVRRGVPAFSALVAAAGLYWLADRTIFS